MAEMVVRVGADVNGAVQGMNLVQQRVQYLENSIKFFQDKLANTQSQKFYANALDIIARKKKELAQITKATGTALDRTSSQTNRATQSMTDLSRIVQDAPYGFIGIANNINPLIESFGRLKASTGSTGGAMKALGATLAGPAGIGLAIAVASSLLVKFSDDLFGSGKAANKAKDEMAEFKKSLDNAKAGALSTGLQLQSFVDIAKNGNLPLEQRNEALRKANDILGNYGKTLTLANVATETATRLVQDYTNGLIAQALAGQYADRIASLLVKQATAQEEVTKAQIEYNKAQQAFVSMPSMSIRDREMGRGQVFIIQRDNALKKLNESQETYAQITKEVTDLTKQFNVEALKSSELLGEVGVKPPKIKKDKYDLKKIFELEFASLEIELPITFDTNQAMRDGAIMGQSFIEGVANATKTSGGVTPENIRAKNFAKAYENLKEVIAANSETIAANINNVVGSAFRNLFEALRNGENAFRAFAQGVGTALLSVVEKIIATAAAAAVLSIIFPGGLNGAKGFKNIFGSLIGLRANGGPVTGSSPYIVGERGPELFVPSVSGNVIPNNRLSSFNGRPAFAGGMGGRSIVRGSDILLSYARTQRSQSRVNG